MQNTNGSGSGRQSAQRSATTYLKTYLNQIQTSLTFSETTEESKRKIEAAIKLAGLNFNHYIHPDTREKSSASPESKGDLPSSPGARAGAGAAAGAGSSDYPETFQKKAFKALRKTLITFSRFTEKTDIPIIFHASADNIYDFLCLGHLDDENLRKAVNQLLIKTHPDKVGSAFPEASGFIFNYLTQLKEFGVGTFQARNLAGLSATSYTPPPSAPASPFTPPKAKKEHSPTTASSRTDALTESLARKKLTRADIERLHGLGRRDFSEANLSNLDLSRMNLTEANFIRADLHMANLVGSNLQGAKLTAEQLLNLHSRGLALKGIDLTESDLSS